MSLALHRDHIEAIRTLRRWKGLNDEDELIDALAKAYAQIDYLLVRIKAAEAERDVQAEHARNAKEQVAHQYEVALQQVNEQIEVQSQIIRALRATTERQARQLAGAR